MLIERLRGAGQCSQLMSTIALILQTVDVLVLSGILAIEVLLWLALQIEDGEQDLTIRGEIIRFWRD
jgi:hypothetical protein